MCLINVAGLDTLVSSHVLYTHVEAPEEKVLQNWIQAEGPSKQIAQNAAGPKKVGLQEKVGFQKCPTIHNAISRMLRMISP